MHTYGHTNDLQSLTIVDKDELKMFTYKLI